MRSLAGLWRHPDFLRLWAAQSLAALSANVTTLAIPIMAAVMLHASPFEMGLLSTMATIPNILIGLFAGPLADRARRRPIMIAMDLCRAVLLLSIPIAAVVDQISIWQLYAVMFICGICTTIFDVANVSYLPSLVSRSQLMSANSRIVASTSFAGAVGPGLAGGLVQALTAPIAILVDACSLVVSGILMLTIRAQEPKPGQDIRHGIWKEIHDGLRPLYRDPVLRSIAVSSMIYLFFSSIMVSMYVLYATRSLGIMPGTLGLIFGMGGAGALLGALIAMQAAHRAGLGPALIVANLVGGLFILLVPLAGSMPSAAVPLLMAAQFGSQSMGAIFVIIQTSLRQMITPERLLGRMNASYRFLTMGIIPIGSFVGGVLGETIGLGPTLVVGGLGMLLPTLWLFLSPIRTIHRVGVEEQ